MTDPIRLRDPRSTATSELRALLAAGRSELPDAERLRGVAARIGLVPAVAPVKPATSLGTAAVTKIGIAALILAAGTGVATFRGRSMSVAPAPTPMPAPTPTRAQGAAQSAEPAVLPIQRTVTETAETRSTSTVSAPRAWPSRSAASPAATPKLTTDPADAAAPTAARGSGWAPSTWGSSVAAVPDTPAEDDPAHALAVAEREERVDGGLVEERDLVIIRSLVRLGRLEEARQRVERFLRVFPGSAHRKEVAAQFGFDPGRQNP